MCAVPAGFLGVTAQDPAARAFIESKLVPGNAAKFNGLLTECPDVYIPAFAGEDIFGTYFTVPLEAVLSDPLIATLIEDVGVMYVTHT